MSRRGVALAGAILALAIVGVVVSAVFLLAVQEQRMGVSMLRHQEAFAAAEGAARQAAWDARYARMPVGGTHTATGQSAGWSGWHRVAVRRLSEVHYLVQAEGFSADSTVRQTAGLLLRTAQLRFPAAAALQSGGPVTVAQGSDVSGADAVPPSWVGCRAGPGPLPATIAFVDSGRYLESIRERVNWRLPGGAYHPQPTATQGTCDAAVLTNWGDPFAPGGPCGDYFPLVWVDGDAVIRGGRGQGVLVVAGDLEVTGGFEFYGALWVTGALRTSGAGGRIRGSVVASSVELRQTGLHGGPVIAFSSCALARALAFSASATPVRPRGWLEML